MVLKQPATCLHFPKNAVRTLDAPLNGTARNTAGTVPAMDPDSQVTENCWTIPQTEIWSDGVEDIEVIADITHVNYTDDKNSTEEMNYMNDTNNMNYTNDTKDTNDIDYKEMPMGFMMALAKKPDAMKRFSELSETDKKDILSALHTINSKEEMQHFVDDMERFL